jgi:hypothetical protein
MQMIGLVQSTSFNWFQAIKHEIENELTIFKFPGQSVKEDLVSAFIIKAKELENYGMYQHRLMILMINHFLEGGGTSNEVSFSDVSSSSVRPPSHTRQSTHECLPS